MSVRNNENVALQPPKIQHEQWIGLLSGVGNIAWPPVLTGAAASLATLVQYFGDSEWLSGEVIKNKQYEQVGALSAHAGQHSPYFQQRLMQAGLNASNLASPDGFKRLPVLKRSDVQKAGQTFYCTEIPKSHMPFKHAQTSGSTGQPVRVIRTALSSLLWQANTLREHFWHKRDFMGDVLVIQSDENKKYIRQKDWGKPVGLLFQSGNARSMPITTDIKRQVEEIIEYKPQHLLIYPSNLDAIIKLCQKEHIELPGVEHIWVRSETLSADVKKKAEVFFGASVEDNYSCEEMGVMALQCPQSGLYHVMSESVIVEVLDENGKDCEEGEVGKVVVTSLHNFATPFIRYAVGDYAEVGGACPCGRKLPTLKRILGRERNLISNPDGTRHWPRIGIELFSDIDLIHQYQFIQHSLNEIEVRLVVKDGKLNAAQEAGLIKHLHGTMKHAFSIRFSYFDESLPLSARGKFEEFISHVSSI